MLTNIGSSTQIITTVPESPTIIKAISINSNLEPPQIPIQQNGVSHEPVAILWDIENCRVPSEVRPEDVAGNIRMALNVHPVIKGSVVTFSAYGDFSAFSRRLREGCQRTGVKLIDVPNGRKDASDKAILIDMFLFAMDHRPPSTIVLISGDVDFAPALHVLGQRGYTIVLVIPSGVGVSSALINAGRFVWDWPTVARGEGFVPQNSSVPRRYDITRYLMGCNIGDNLEGQSEEENIVYQGNSNDHAYCSNSSHAYREITTVSEYSGNNLACGPLFASSRSQNLPLAYGEAPTGYQSSTQDQSLWVIPGDVQGLKGQLVKLLELFGGSLPLVRIPAEYIRSFGRPLYMAEYGVSKLVHLINKMSDAFVVAGKGHEKHLFIRNSPEVNRSRFLTIGMGDAGNRQVNKLTNTPIILKNDKRGKGAMLEDNGICRKMSSSSDEVSEEDKIAEDFEDRLRSFRLEMQELTVCYSGPIPASSFKALYEQRYQKTLDYQSFGVDGLEELLEKARLPGVS